MLYNIAHRPGAQPAQPEQPTGLLGGLTSGLTRRQVADDLGVGLSTLNKWVTAHRDTDVVSPEDRELARENERLRREIRILKEERDILKKATQFFASQKP